MIGQLFGFLRLQHETGQRLTTLSTEPSAAFEQIKNAFLARCQTFISFCRQRKRDGAVLQMFEIDLHRLRLLGLLGFLRLACVIGFLSVVFLGIVGFVFIGVLVAGVLRVLCVLVFVFILVLIFVFVFVFFPCFRRLLVFTLRRNGRRRVRRQRQSINAARDVKFIAAHVQPTGGGAVIRAFEEVEILSAAVKGRITNIAHSVSDLRVLARRDRVQKECMETVRDGLGVGEP